MHENVLSKSLKTDSDEIFDLNVVNLNNFDCLKLTSSIFVRNQSCLARKHGVYVQKWLLALENACFFQNT